VDLIHLNEFTGLVPMLIARHLFKVPVIVHVRSVARDDRHSLRTRLVNWILKEKAAAVVAIDQNVRASLPASLPVDVVHNAFTPGPGRELDCDFQAKLDQLRKSSFKVGFVGNLLRVKGLYDLIEAARIIKMADIDVEFVIGHCVAFGGES
jgi:glycosyltransferase involved in cell wall biosynthesis